MPRQAGRGNGNAKTRQRKASEEAKQGDIKQVLRQGKARAGNSRGKASSEAKQVEASHVPRKGKEKQESGEARQG